jgi:hypothetical protein
MTWQLHRQRDFTGGENRLILPEFMASNQLIVARNCVMTAEGTLQTRLGKTRLNDNSIGSGKVISLHRYAKENGNKYLLAQHGTTLYSVSWDGASTFSSFSSIKTSLNAAKLYGHTWRDNLILSNGVDNPFRFDGSTCTDLAGSPPKFSIFCIYAGRIWCVDVDNPNTIRFSDLENFGSWPALNLIKVRDGDGDVITALLPVPGGMLIIKNKTIWPLYGTNKDNLVIAPSPLAEVGAPSQDVVSPAGVIMGHNGFYQVSLSEVTPIANTHRRLVEQLTNTAKSSTVAATLNNETQVVVNSESFTLVLDGRYQGVTSWGGLNIGSLAVADAAGDGGELLVGDNTNGIVYLLTNHANDDGVSIQTVIQTAFTDYGSIREKEWRYFLADFEPLGEMNGLVFLQYDLDYSEQTGIHTTMQTALDILDWGEDSWNEAYWGTGHKVKETYWLHKVRGDMISFTVTASDRIMFKGYVTKFREVGPR